MLHHCQKYELSGHTFAKRKVPHDFFRCAQREGAEGAAGGGGGRHKSARGTAEALSAPPAISFPFDPGAIVNNVTVTLQEAAGKPKARVTLRTAFMLCHLIPMMNRALAKYQREVCGDKAAASAIESPVERSGSGAG